MDYKEVKFKVRENINKSKIILLYMFKEPLIEIRRLINGYYNSVLMFWVSIILYIILWKQSAPGWKMKVAGFLIFLTYLIMFVKDGSWKEYYKKEYIKGEKVE